MTSGHKHRHIQVFAGACAIAVAWLGGCSHHTAPDTGSTQAAQQYVEAFCKQDWTQAYAQLDPDSRTHDSVDQYTQWVSDYRRRLGFEVDNAVILWTRETGDKAVVTAWLTGHDGARKLTKEMALSLHRNGEHWCVVLPAAAQVAAAR